MKSKTREIKTLTSGLADTDSEGVDMTQFIGTPELKILDPFLLFDAFESD